jgi:hypothetical protein
MITVKTVRTAVARHTVRISIDAIPAGALFKEILRIS